MKYDFINFLKTIVENCYTKKFLLGVSGGIDSMVMLNLFKTSNLNFAVANINFQLRGQESIEDSIMVKKYCLENNIQLYQTTFETAEFAKQNKLSIQMAARELRYDWFKNILTKDNFDLIAIAHHLDDQTETFFINLIRGTGVAGMHGISKNNNTIIRPLMFCNREKIEKFASSQNVPFREDSSNASDKYLRNYIRHNITPHFFKLNEKFSTTLDTSLEYISDLEKFAEAKIEEELASVIVKKEYTIFSISITEMLKSKFPKLILYHALKEYNFKKSHIENIFELIENKETGKKIKTSTHTIIIDRNYLLLQANDKTLQESDNHIFIKNIEELKALEKTFKITFPYIGNYINSNNKIAYLDFEKLIFPLELRLWKNGDYFFPLGMSGKQKISDYITNQKMTFLEKQNLKVLCSENKIIWVIGHRIDKNFAIDSNTKNILKLEYYGNN